MLKFLVKVFYRNLRVNLIINQILNDHEVKVKDLEFFG